MTARITAVAAGGAQVSTELVAGGGPDIRERARVETLRWIKDLRLARYDGVTMRERFRYGDDSLWWFTEIYLHKMRRLDTAIATVLALDAAIDRWAPSRLAVETTDGTVRSAALAVSAARTVPIDVTGAIVTPRGNGFSGLMVGWSARLSRLRPSTPRTATSRAGIAAFVHTAFWRPSESGGPEQENYIGEVLGAVDRAGAPGELAYVGVGPRRNFRARRWWDAVRPDDKRPLVTPIERLAPGEALAGALDLWRRREQLAEDITRGDGIRQSGVVLGCDLWPILRRELEGVALVQWPWSARAIDEAGGAIDTLDPRVVVTYAEAGGWGRAIALAARRRGVPSVGVQHGFIYRHWLNYRHEADEMMPVGSDRGFPRPDQTLLFDRYAALSLERQGCFPASALTVTGSARLDALSERVARLAPRRAAIRRDLNVGADQALAVLAAKYSEIREELPALVTAVAARPDVRLVVKTHPAETPDVYEPVTRGVPNVTVAPAEADLASLVAAADGLVTMNSTVAIDGLVLGVPALVLGLPNNLSPFVEAGVMLGAPAGTSIEPALAALLYDRDARAALLSRAAQFATRFDMRADGGAAERAARVIRSLGASRASRE